MRTRWLQRENRHGGQAQFRRAKSPEGANPDTVCEHFVTKGGAERTHHQAERLTGEGGGQAHLNPIPTLAKLPVDSRGDGDGGPLRVVKRGIGPPRIVSIVKLPLATERLRLSQSRYGYRLGPGHGGEQERADYQAGRG